jgi:hypothetical protein
MLGLGFWMPHKAQTRVVQLIFLKVIAITVKILFKKISAVTITIETTFKKINRIYNYK